MATLLFLMGQRPVAAAADNLRQETLAGRVEAKNGFAWNYGFDVERRDDGVRVQVAINLIPAGTVIQADLEGVKSLWEAGIERIWSRRCALIGTDGRCVPIVADVTFKGPRFHHEVIVRREEKRRTALDWNLRDDARIVAHEFGHLLGLYDEYPGGATDPAGAVLERDSVMANDPAGSALSARHFERVRAWFVRGSGVDGRVAVTAGTAMEARHE